MDHQLQSQALDPDFMEAARHQLKSAKVRLEKIRTRIEALRQEEDKLQRVAASLENLITSAGGKWEEVQARTKAIHCSSAVQEAADSIEPQTRVQADIAVEILEEQGKEPMHYRKLTEEVQMRGGKLNGQDPSASLNAVLNRDDRFVRPFRRGYYALRKHYPNLRRNVGTRRRG